MGPRPWFVSMCLLVVSVGTVAADTGAPADPQPGFGALIAFVALLIAFVIARRKRRKAAQVTEAESSGKTAEAELAVTSE